MFFALTGVVIEALPGRWCPYESNGDGAAGTPLKNPIPGLEWPDFGGPGGGCMDQKWRNLKWWFLPRQGKFAEIVSAGLEKGHAAQQLSDVVAVELSCVSGEKGWGIPVRVREETLLG